jgi:hypothetical protein
MTVRALIIASALAVSACNPQPTPEPDADSPGTELPVAAELLANEALAGAWAMVGDGATVGVLFTPTDYENTLAIGCNTGTGQAYINWTISDPAEDTEVRVYTAAETVTFAATAINDGVAMRAVDVVGTDPRLAALTASQERFAVQASGEAIVVPWDPSIAEVLNACAAST